MIILNSNSIHGHGNEIGCSVITTTTTDFLSYKEKWSQWYIATLKLTKL